MTHATAVLECAPDRARDLRRAIARTVAYADLFDFPLSRAEIHRYLIDVPASQADVDRALDADAALAMYLERTGDQFHLRGRAGIVETRRRRAATSTALWRAARAYAAWIARLPLVRFVGVTGALAMDNADRGADIDLFVLARPRRLWVCRLLVLAVVRLAALRGVRLCPNFVLSTERLALRERNLFTAHEIAQMVPLRGTRWYDAFIEANGWTREHLPNATAPRDRLHGEPLVTRVAAAVLALRVFDPLERWEMRRKIRRLTERGAIEGGSLAFSPDECRGHFAAHDVRVLAEFAERSAAVEATLP